MIKLTFCLTRLPHLTRDAFQAYWFDSIESVIENGRRPEAQAAAAMLLQDERRFIDLARSPLRWGEEKPVVG